jgi:hypothetical protein
VPQNPPPTTQSGQLQVPTQRPAAPPKDSEQTVVINPPPRDDT